MERLGLETGIVEGQVGRVGQVGERGVMQLLPCYTTHGKGQWQCLYINIVVPSHMNIIMIVKLFLKCPQPRHVT